MAHTKTSRIDFDYWSQLARRDPDGFERLRSQILEACIQHSSNSHQHRLRCLQWRIDQVRETASNPLSACISISNMMWDRFNNLKTGYQHLDSLRHGHHLPQLPSATILPFTPQKT